MANINDIVFMKPSVDDTQADRMRIPAAANAMGKVVTSIIWSKPWMRISLNSSK